MKRTGSELQPSPHLPARRTVRRAECGRAGVPTRLSVISCPHGTVFLSSRYITTSFRTFPQEGQQGGVRCTNSCYRNTTAFLIHPKKPRPDAKCPKLPHEISSQTSPLCSPRSSSRGKLHAYDKQKAVQKNWATGRSRISSSPSSMRSPRAFFHRRIGRRSKSPVTFWTKAHFSLRMCPRSF